MEILISFPTIRKIDASTLILKFAIPRIFLQNISLHNVLRLFLMYANMLINFTTAEAQRNDQK